MTVYLAGAISYDVEKAKKDFADAETQLIKSGYEVVNPFAVIEDTAAYYEQIRKTLAAMLLCDAVAYIENDAMQGSAGLKRELEVAKDLSMLSKPLSFYTKRVPKDAYASAKVANNLFL